MTHTKQRFNSRLTSTQIALIVAVSVLVGVTAVLALSTYFNITSTASDFDESLMVSDLSEVQRELFRLHVITQDTLVDPDAPPIRATLQRAVLANHLIHALAEANGHQRVIDSLANLITGLEEYDRLLGLFTQSTLPQSRTEIAIQLNNLLIDLERQVIAFYVEEETRLYSEMRAALASQRNAQTALIGLSTSLLLLNILLALSIRRSVRRDFDRAYNLMTLELLERERVEGALLNAKEDAEAANRAKSDFVSLVSHELKSPMTSIKGYARLLSDGMAGVVNEQQQQFLYTIDRNVERMNRLVSDLADISRIEAGRLHLERSNVPLHEVIAEVTQLAGMSIREKRQTLSVALPDDLPPVYSDRTRLLQILTNLVSNANKYTPPGGSVVIEACRMVRQNGVNGSHPVQDMVQVTVQDTGIGIQLNEQMRIFEKFFRSEDHEARAVPGTGLGLSITKNLVEMHGGRIWFESEYQQGTTFHFTVPVATLH